jgi:farnesyl-diphosphate farnesyltransferase
MLREVSRSMHLGLMALPGEVREAMGLGYLLCRAADTIADTKLVPPEKRSRYLGTLRGVLQGLRDPLEASREIAGALLPSQERLCERRLLDQLSVCFKAWKGLPEAERTLTKEVVESVTEGMRMDSKAKTRTLLRMLSRRKR